MNLQAALKASRELIAQRNHQAMQHIRIDNDKVIVYGQNGNPNRIYVPTSTMRVFHNDNTFVRVIRGPYGSGKSTGCQFEIVKRACAMPVWYKGRRRSKWAIVRNTSGELQSTTLQTWLTWFSDLGDIKKRQKPLMTYEHVFNDGNGIVELELIFIALDREDDVRKIKSLEVTGCYINELSEVPQAALSHFKGRVNHRYPSKSFCDEPYWSGIIADTNPPDVDHWMYKEFELQTLESYRMFSQPHGLIKNDSKWTRNPDADNASNLADDYYLKLAEGQSEDFVKVFCLGEYGSVGFGKKVYPEYSDDLHSVEFIIPIQGSPIHLGWDFGLTPACIVIQFDDRGRLLVIKEYVAEDMGIRTFAQSIVLPGLSRDFPYHGNLIGESTGDQSGKNRNEIWEELSSIGELNSLGIKTNPSSSNALDVRLGSVRFYLNIMIDGKPGCIISRKGCPTLRRGFVKDYCYKRIAIAGEERYRDEPDKNMSSHPHDAFQYACMPFAANSILAKKAPIKMVDMYNPVMRWSQ